MRSVLSRMVAGTTCLAIATLGLGGVAMAATDSGEPIGQETRACTLYANKPFKSGTNVVAEGGRTGCSNRVDWVSVQLKHAQPYPLPHTIVASNKYTSVIDLNGRAQTTGRSGAVYYTYTVSSTGATMQSSNFPF